MSKCLGQNLHHRHSGHDQVVIRNPVAFIVAPSKRTNFVRLTTIHPLTPSPELTTRFPFSHCYGITNHGIFRYTVLISPNPFGSKNRVSELKLWHIVKEGVMKRSLFFMLFILPLALFDCGGGLPGDYVIFGGRSCCRVVRRWKGSKWFFSCPTRPTSTVTINGPSLQMKMDGTAIIFSLSGRTETFL